ncbi:helix-turn-helix transcriptional regulator [Janthinobacterium lividum]|uniref:helix-turn-helix domain-containing protein n=1 Tax=Janthinobacterium lividum TaxID=29581 RepID=UPI001594FF0C|nr:helix-turn-helix transcriptional regulator [Janthinobacterium lividum]QKY03605.1 helix-turn-helix transcriptional regulator [Janthinobacterium lividum]
MPIPSFEQANELNVQDVQRLISDRIRHERRRLGLTQVIFAARCGIALRTYKRLELGESDSIGALIRVAQYLGRAPGFDMLFPPPMLKRPARGIDAAMLSIRAKMDARVVKGEGALDDPVSHEQSPDDLPIH